MHISGRCTHGRGPGLGNCSVGDHTLVNVTVGSARAAAHSALAAGMQAAMARHRISTASSQVVAIEDGGGRSLYTTPGLSVGVETFLVLRVALAAMASQSAIVTSAVAATMCSEMVDFFVNQS